MISMDLGVVGWRISGCSGTLTLNTPVHSYRSPKPSPPSPRATHSPSTHSPLMASAATPKFKLFSLSRTRTPTRQREKPPPVITRPLHPIWQTDFDGGSQGFRTREGTLGPVAAVEQYTPTPTPTPRVRTAPPTLARPPRPFDPRTPRDEQPALQNHYAPVSTPSLYISAEPQQSPFVDSRFESRLQEPDLVGGRHDSAAKTVHHAFRGAQSARPQHILPTMRQRGRPALASVDHASEAHHTPDARRVKESPAVEEGVDLGEYPWYFCQNVEGKETKLHLSGRRAGRREPQ
jgi:hypothetical protein